MSSKAEGTPGTCAILEAKQSVSKMREWAPRTMSPGSEDGDGRLAGDMGDLIPGFDPWVKKIPWRRKWPLTPVFLPGECHGQRATVHGIANSQI